MNLKQDVRIKKRASDQQTDKFGYTIFKRTPIRHRLGQNHLCNSTYYCFFFSRSVFNEALRGQTGY
jgi:hypothetical protein